MFGVNLSEIVGVAGFSHVYVFISSGQTNECAAYIFYVCDEGTIGDVWCEFKQNRRGRRFQ